MKILSFGRAVCVAAVVAGALIAPGMASAGVVVSAPQSDYPEFRKLAGRLRLVDAIAAENGDRLGHKPGEVKSATWRAALRKSLERSLGLVGDKTADALMRAIFPAFSHEEIAQLTLIAAGPLPRRFEDARVEAFYTGADLGKVTADLHKDPDYLAMSRADVRLFGQFLQVARTASPAALDQLIPAIATAKAEADAADTGEVPPPPSWDPPRLVIGGTWTLPGASDLDPVWPNAARVDGLEGMPLIQCNVTVDGRAAHCDALFVNVDKADAAAVAAVYEARAHVDPATVPGGIKSGARIYFVARYKAG